MKIFKILFYSIIALNIFQIQLLFADDLQLPFHGFAEYGFAGRLSGNIYKSNDILMNEARGQFEFSKELTNASMILKIDALYDSVKKKSIVDIREANISLFPSQRWELKAGRQILTWGTGDLVFVNDLFPKDWNAFFIGRADEYLKAPSDALKLSVFYDFGTFNFIVSPQFTPDEYITGERMSYWGPGGMTGNIFNDSRPESKLKNCEYHFRFSKNISGFELALYSYKGFMKRPLGFDMNSGYGYFPRLAVHGFSGRMQALGGILNLESGYYDSIDDRNGKNLMIENSMIKTVVGFEKEIAQNLTAAFQYFSEYMTQYSDYKLSAENMGQRPYKEKNHDWITARLTNMRNQETLILSFFGYYSPAEEDWHLRPSVTYKMSDQVSLSAGLNVFGGKNYFTFFGQLEDNTNAYCRIKFAF